MMAAHLGYGTPARRTIATLWKTRSSMGRCGSDMRCDCDRRSGFERCRRLSAQGAKKARSGGGLKPSLRGGLRGGVKNDTAIIFGGEIGAKARQLRSRNRLKSQKGAEMPGVSGAQRVAPGGKSRKQGAISYSQMHHSRLLGVAGSATPAPISSLWVCSWAL